jgi:murein DD-endopeptidase MepM/ murein hydrolase activator NlpD
VAVFALSRALLAVVAALACLGVVSAPDTALAASHARPFIWPTTGRITQQFGCTGYKLEPRRGKCAHFHYGVDIANHAGTPVYAAADGVVFIAGWDPWLKHDPDWMVMIRHANGYETMYAHLQVKLAKGIKKGVHVKQGQLIGYMGSTGRSTGPHLLWGVFDHHQPVNPLNFVRGNLKRG